VEEPAEVQRMVSMTPIPEAELLEEYREWLLDRLEEKTNEDLEQRFESSALGTPHYYKSDVDGQINIIGAVMAGVDMYYSCADVNGVVKMRYHTAAQISQVFQDGVTFKQTIMNNYYAKKDEIETATITELKGIIL